MQHEKYSLSVLIHDFDLAIKQMCFTLGIIWIMILGIYNIEYFTKIKI
jgi:hypothetical protein